MTFCDTTNVTDAIQTYQRNSTCGCILEIPPNFRKNVLVVNQGCSGPDEDEIRRAGEKVIFWYIAFSGFLKLPENGCLLSRIRLEHLSTPGLTINYHHSLVISRL